MNPVNKVPFQQINVHLFGNVQGVNFRRQTVQWAEQHNVRGWVRNEPDGSVRICAQGDAAALHALIEWVMTDAPGHTDRTAIQWQPCAFPERDFQIHY